MSTRIKNEVFLSYQDLLDYLADQGPLYQFQVAYVNAIPEEGEPALWYINIPIGSLDRAEKKTTKGEEENTSSCEDTEA